MTKDQLNTILLFTGTFLGANVIVWVLAAIVWYTSRFLGF